MNFHLKIKKTVLKELNGEKKFAYRCTAKLFFHLPLTLQSNIMMKNSWFCYCPSSDNPVVNNFSNKDMKTLWFLLLFMQSCFISSIFIRGHYSNLYNDSSFGRRMRVTFYKTKALSKLPLKCLVSFHNKTAFSYSLRVFCCQYNHHIF